MCYAFVLPCYCLLNTGLTLLAFVWKEFSSSDLRLFPFFFFGGNFSSYEIQNVGGGTSVLRVMATDRDIGPNAMLFYYITAGNQDLTFRMDRMTGEMVTRPAPPDRERQQEYILTVTVEDDGTPPLSVSSRELQEVHSFDFSIRCGFSEEKYSHWVEWRCE